MHLTLTSPAAPDSTDPRTVDIGAAGMTIGSDAHNDWIADRDPHNLCAVHAAIRVDNGVYTLVNLASRLPVTVNGSPLACQSSARLQPGDDITLGACRVTAQASSPEAPTHEPSMSASAAHRVMPDAKPATAAADIDPFADLLGPGTLPLGTAPALDTTHPFDMASAAPRNAADPLAGWAQRPDDAHAARTRDPLDLFDANACQEVPDVFTDHTPSVLDRDPPKRS